MPPPVPERKLVIVVDDDPAFLKAVGRLLTAQGFDSELFSSVLDFHSRAQLDRASCLLLDIDLNGESGIELRRKITASGRATPVVFMTGNDTEGARQAAIEAGCIDFLRKPFVAKSLMNALERACAESIRVLPPTTASSTPASPFHSGDRPLPRIFQFSRLQAALERAHFREERMAATCRHQELIAESEELIAESVRVLREVDKVLGNPTSCAEAPFRKSVGQRNERSR